MPRSKQQHALLLLKPAPTRTGERDERIKGSVLEPNRKCTPVAQSRVWCDGASDVGGNAYVNRQAAALANAQADLPLAPQHLDAFEKRFEFLLAITHNHRLAFSPCIDLSIETIALHLGALHSCK